MTNIKLTYEYTLNSIKVVNESIDKINTKLALIITFGGILINFGKDLPEYSLVINSDLIKYYCWLCYIMKLSAYIFIIKAIAIALWGLSPNVGGKIILPEQLISDEWNNAAEEEYLTALTKYLEKETLLVLNDIRDYQASRLSWAIRSIAIAVILLGLDEILGISLPVIRNFF